MKMTARDQKLLDFLSDYGCFTTKQVCQAVFPETNSSTVLRRLRILEKQNLLHRNFGLENGKLVWSLSVSGARKIGLESHPGSINRNTLEHTVLLNDIRLRLETLGVAKDWKPDHVLQRETKEKGYGTDYAGDILPDALFAAKVIKNKQHSIIALELELSLKGRKRYKEIFYQYDRKENVSLLWYIVPNDRYGLKLYKAWKEIKYKQEDGWFRWTTVKEIFGDPQKVELKNATTSFFLTQRLESNLQTPQVESAQTSAQPVSSLIKPVEN